MFTCLQSQPLVVLGMLHPMAAVTTAAALYSNQRTVTAFIAAHVHQWRRHSGGTAAARRRTLFGICRIISKHYLQVFLKSDPARNLAVFLSLNVTALAKNFATSFVKKSSSKFCSYYESCLPLFLKLELDAQNLFRINGCFPTISSQFFANYMCTFHRTDVKQSF